MVEGADLLVSAIENEGSSAASASLEDLCVLDSLRNSTIKLVLTRHEQVAALLALQVLPTHQDLGQPIVWTSRVCDNAHDFCRFQDIFRIGPTSVQSMLTFEVLVKSGLPRFISRFGTVLAVFK
ncbi:hypothetical protein [Neorhizobium galegae]|uniref:hypothetical protein n=1 Tax=Neorhizobium galegae TaxID=399 RepID=UPI000627B04F|nr:hypothetical protein [Neorhizobium galegae]